MVYKEIEWDYSVSDPSRGAFENHGTNGHGLIARFEIVGTKGRVVNLSFQCFIDYDEAVIDGKTLATLSQEIGELIHYRLGV